MSEKKNRVLFKISGEILKGDNDFGIDVKRIDKVANEVASAHAAGYELCLVIGGGNIYRGISGASQGMSRVSADHLGMLATVMNAIAFQHYLEKKGIYSIVMSAVDMPAFCEPFIRRKALKHLEKKRIVIFAAGTGNPFFTTDTAAALRASEMECDVLLKGTKVDGVYSDDPVKNKDAIFYKNLSYSEVVKRNLGVMDMSAIMLSQNMGIPIKVFDIMKDGNLLKILNDEGRFTKIEG